MKIALERVNEDYLFQATNPNGHHVLLDNKSKTTGEVQGNQSYGVIANGSCRL